MKDQDNKLTQKNTAATPCEVFAKNLRTRRRELSMTQRELAERLGYSEKSVSKWESGEAIAPSAILPSLSQALETSIDSLFAREGLPSYYLGIDGGGTKTEFALADSFGKIISRTTLESSNAIDIGIKRSLDVLASGIAAVTGSIPPSRISVFAGIAGGITGDNRERILDFLKKYGFARADSGSDAQNAVACALGQENGTAVIMGTGSIAFSRIDGKLIRRGGWGYLFEEGGSGYAVGRDAIIAALGDEEGSAPHTLITEFMRDELGGSGMLDSLSSFYEGGKRAIASFARAVFEAHSKGDAVAKDILERNMRAVARLIESTPDTSEGAQRIVLVGGLARDASLLIPMIKQALARAEHYDISADTTPPVMGALILAGADVKNNKENENA